MITTLLLLGLALGFDSFRVSVGLGALKPSRRRQVALATAFGLCDGLAPLVGLWLGRGIVEWLHRSGELLGPAVLGGYGLYLIVVSRLGHKSEDKPCWQLFGLPLALSIDNLIAGASLGMIGFPALLSAWVIGLISGLMAFAGLCLGGVLVRRLPIQAEVLSGAILLIAALLNVSVSTP